MFGLNGEQVVHRARALAAEHAARLDLPATASDAQLHAAFDAVGRELGRDRKLRRPLQDGTIRSIVDSLVMWEVLVAVVGKDAAEARWFALRGVEPPAADAEPAPDRGAVPPPPPPPPPPPGPTGPAASARSVARRPRRLPDVHVDPGLADAVHAEPTSATDPLRRDGYDHSLWLEEWLELAVGTTAFDGLEAAVRAHPAVDAAMHMDREVLYVAAPALHPEDVRQVVLGALADAYDPGWERHL